MTTKAQETASLLNFGHDFHVGDRVWWAGDEYGDEGVVIEVRSSDGAVGVHWDDQPLFDGDYYTQDFPPGKLDLLRHISQPK